MEASLDRQSLKSRKLAFLHPHIREAGVHSVKPKDDDFAGRRLSALGFGHKPATGAESEEGSGPQA
jgi:hypothetical protein